MDTYLSDKLKVLSFFSIMLVVCHHSRFGVEEIENLKLISYIQNSFLTNMIGRCVIPLFFGISGYLFFLGITNGINSIFVKIKKRFRTLLIPYLFAAIFCVLFYVFVAIAPGTAGFTNGAILLLFDKEWCDIFLSIFYSQNGGHPIAYQLWFLQDLIILVLLSPLWYVLFKYLKWSWLPVVLLLIYLKISYFPFVSLFWFSLGGCFAPLTLKRSDSKLGTKLLLLFLSIGFVELFYVSPIWEYLKIPVICLGLASVWLCYDQLVSETFSLKDHTALSLACSFTFFIYLYHVPAVNVVRKIIMLALGKNEIGYFLSFLLSPYIFVFFAVLLGIQLKRFTPHFYALITGGRC